jgi:hypothetical protein
MSSEHRSATTLGQTHPKPFAGVLMINVKAESSSRHFNGY